MMASRLPHQPCRRLGCNVEHCSISVFASAAAPCGHACPLAEPLQYISANEPPNGLHIDHAAVRGPPSPAPWLLQDQYKGNAVRSCFDQFRKSNSIANLKCTPFQQDTDETRQERTKNILKTYLRSLSRQTF